MHKNSEQLKTLYRTRSLAVWLDSRFGVGKFTLGWDAIIGLIPGVGDVVTSALSSYIIYEAAQAGASFPVLLRMAGNIVVESVVGIVPVFGDLFDIAWKSNLKNVKLLEAALTEPRRTTQRSALLVASAVIVLFLFCLSIISLPFILLFVLI